MHNEDFRNRENILLIMRSFYDKLLADSSISYLFTVIAHLDLEHHFPKLASWFENLQKNEVFMEVHQDIFNFWE
jgi:hemoglobin